MQHLNDEDLYNSILSVTHNVVTEIWMYNANDSNEADPIHVFSEDEITSATTYCSLFEGGKPSVGGAVSAEIDLTLLTSVEVPRMAKLKPYVYLTDGTRESERLPKGVFWVDTRKTDVTTGELHIHGYDAMLKAEQYFINDDADIFEMIGAKNLRDKAVVIDGFEYKRLSITTPYIHHPSIAEMMGIGVNAETIATINKNYIVPFVCSFDYDDRTGEVTNTILKGTTMTCRELLQNIAAAYCGNFIIDEFGELKLVRFPNFETERGVIVTGAGQPITFGGIGIKWG